MVNTYYWDPYTLSVAPGVRPSSNYSQEGTLEDYRAAVAEHEAANPPLPEPDWIGFIVEFSLSGNSLYNATATKVQASGEVTKEHWSNLKLGLNISEIRSIEWLQLSYNYLLYLLEVNNQALTIEEKQAWLDMANKHNITIE